MCLKTMSSANMFWNLMYEDVFNDLKNSADVLVLIVHWNLVRNFELKCIGTGEKQNEFDIEQGDELLPANWNLNESAYTLRYRHGTQNLYYILTATVNDDFINFNLTNIKTIETSITSFRLSGTVKPLGDLIHIERLVPTVRKIIDRLDVDLLKVVKRDLKLKY